MEGVKRVSGGGVEDFSNFGIKEPGLVQASTVNIVVAPSRGLR